MCRYTYCAYLPAVFCHVTNRWGVKGPQHWPVSWASVEPAGQVKAVTNNKFAVRCRSCSLVLWGWRRNRELRRGGSVTVVPPLSALVGLRPLSPCGPVSWLRQRGVFSACLPVVLLSRTSLSDEPGLVCWKASDWQRGLTKWRRLCLSA